MSRTLEIVIIIAVIATAALFAALKILRTARSKRPDCCSGTARVKRKVT